MPEEQELYKNLKRISWQYENCLSCVWFKPNDPVNADVFERGQCAHSKLKEYNLIVSGRDWCNLFKEIPQKTIDALQEKAMKEE
jgi:predicted RND superfamily exporter protein